MTKKVYDNVILGNIDLFVQTAQGGEHKDKFNMMVTSDDPVDLQAHVLEASDEVYKSESGKTVRIVVRPAQVRPAVALSDETAEALKARIAELEANKPAQPQATAPAAGEDIPF